VRWLYALAVMAPALAQAAPLTAVVTNVCSDKGTVMLSVYVGPDWLEEHTDGRDFQQPAHKGETVFHLDLPPGTYAAATYHDANGNGKFDKNVLGWPREGFGFSNNATVLFFTPPSFAQASFELPPEGAAVYLPMAYWSGC